MGEFIQDEIKEISEGEATYALIEGWKSIYDEYPSNKSLALLWAQWALETGRGKAIHCCNFGNLKRSSGDPTDWTMYRCSEIIDNKEVFFDPPHPQTHFRAYRSVIDGAKDYILFLSKRKRYLKAWEEVKNGDPAAFGHELKVAGYYTANEAKYTAIIVKVTNEFLKKADKLLTWVPIVQENKSAIDLANIPIFIPDPDLRSGPAEAEIIPLEMPKNWITNSVNFLKKIFKK